MTPKQKQKTEQATETVPVLLDRPALLESFLELVGERYGYYAARKLTQAEMTEATKKEAEAVRKLNTTVHKKIEEFLETPTDEIKADIDKARKELGKSGKDATGAKKALSEAKAPFTKKMNPLAKIVRYIDNTAIPDSLKELGYAVQPRFSLSDWAKEAIEKKPK